MPVIHPKIDPTPDFPVVQFREPREQVKLDEQLPKILRAQGWLCGTYFHVQFVNHENTELLLDALFVVTKAADSLQTSGPDRAPHTKEVILYEVKQIRSWRFFNGYSKPIDTTEVEEVTQESGKATLKYNPAKDIHVVIVDGKVVYENVVESEAEKVRDILNKAA